tara:strand:- start:685 stop:930 length:246 start_codon:yes stop_codon:yes gene_type:complete
MKPQRALRNALDNPHLYNDDELKKLRNKLDEITYEKEYDQWYRRSSQGFSNEPAPTPPLTDAGSDTVHGVSDGSEQERHQL